MPNFVAEKIIDVFRIFRPKRKPKNKWSGLQKDSEE